MDESDQPYEENLIANAFNVKAWLRYIDFKKEAAPTQIYMLYERALKQLPGSYKLWYRYLKLRRIHARRVCLGSRLYLETNNAHERALVTMHKMPRIWHDYLQFLMYQGYITRTRRTMDRALRSLPITQHQRVWRLYLRFADKHGAIINETGCRIYRRYIKFAPDDKERFVNFLVAHQNFNEAASVLAEIINDENYYSREGKSKFQLWQDLCKMLVENPRKITSLKADPIIRQGISRYSDQVGILWNSLADYYIRDNNLARARDVYSEALNTVVTVRDFTQVFDAFAEFEESIAKAQMKTVESGTGNSIDKNFELDLELSLARLEALISKRPILLNSVLLRQNPHNVAEWLRRVDLMQDHAGDHESKSVIAAKQIGVLMDAISSVEPSKATGGRPSALWIALAKLYEKHDQINDARMVFEKSTGVAFLHVDDLASIWCEWAEMEIRVKQPQRALNLLAKATIAPARKIDYFDKSESVQARLHKSLKLWNLYIDLEESFGNLKTAKAAYDQAIDLRVATPQMIINYGMFLEEHNYFEDAFKAYEKGVALFKWPHVYDLWITYLTKFIDRYGGSKLERTRDLFEQCLDNCPPKYAKDLYLLYARLEENHGLARRANKIYERATESVLPTEKYEMFNIYIQRVAELHGVTHTRSAYELAIENLPENHARQMCLRFAELEKKLGEIDRARAIYAYCAQMCDPRVEVKFWQIWKEFEVAHGDEDNLREMLRIRRSVQATYNTKVSLIMHHQDLNNSNEQIESMNEMERLESQQQTDCTDQDLDGGMAINQPNNTGSINGQPFIKFQSAGFKGDTPANGATSRRKRGATDGRSTVPSTPATVSFADEEINIDDAWDDDEIEMEISKKKVKTGKVLETSVPEEVFGGLKRSSKDTEQN